MYGTSRIEIWLSLMLAVYVGINPLWADKTEQQLLEHGAKVYAQACIGCHGPYGDGKGTERILESIQPRDFSNGIFKYRSTATGQLPTNADLERTVEKGIRQTAMPHHAFMSEQDRRAVVAYTRTFFAGWETGEPAAVVTLPSIPKYVGSTSSLARGKEVYDRLRCAACHGPEGKGDGLQAKTLSSDISGNPQVPFNFVNGMNSFKNGGKPSDIYRTLVTGLNGTDMSAYSRILLDPDGQVIREGDGWHLVYYLLSLRGGPPN